ncbi:hypothetical protein Athai_58720 [Actinocatenispora thailandica]|uniref:Hsp70 protein n=1 Tax=Actinocatenispora thailandica TaxID=227318 RepID=A0A7R7DUZ3_9ACTN|nr:Hsp70 family protein [Actinocatenispora thailandica]BCJ38369.1 hypothetical protein Athai_58720 [Actinocatenispora thailandica]
MASGPSLGIDFGTSSTVGVLRRADGSVRPLLFDGTPLLPSAVYLEPSGQLLTGRDAIHAARLDPTRFEPAPKRHIGEGTVLLGGTEVTAIALAAAVLRRVAVEATRVNGTAVRELTLTHPATWAGPRRDALVQAARRAGLPRPRLVAEPVAAASYFTEVLGHRIPTGSAVVVYDFGAGTFDASAVLSGTHGFDAAVVDGLEIGGLDIDEAVVGWLGTRYGAADPAGWQRLTAPSATGDRRAREQLWTDVRACKEQLSRSSSAQLAVPVLEVDAHLTRDELERLASPLVEQTITATADVIRAAKLTPKQIAGVFLVGGGSRLPLAASMLHRRLGIASTAIEQPELVVAEGSLRSPEAGGGTETRILPALANGARSAAGAGPGFGAAGGQWPAAPTAGARLPSGQPIPAAPQASAPQAPAPRSAPQAPVPRSTPQAPVPRSPVPAPQPAVPRSPAPQLPVSAATSAPHRGSASSERAGAAAPTATRRMPATPRSTGRSATAAGAGRPYRSRRGRSRQAVLAAVLVLLLAGGGLAAWYGYRRATAADGTRSSAGDGRPGFVPAGWQVAVPSLDAQNGWHDNDGTAGSCRLKGGTLTATRTRTADTGMFSCGGGQTHYRNVALDTRVRVQAGCAGIWLRTGDVHGYFLAICADSVALHAISDTDPSETTALHTWPLSRSAIGRSIRIGVLARDDNFTVYANGRKLGAPVRDDQITTGRIDLGVFAPKHDATAVFTTARAWHPADAG